MKPFSISCLPSLVLFVGVALAPSSHAATTYSYAIIDVPGAIRSGASGINNNGQIVGSYIDAANIVHGFIDNAGVFATLDARAGVNNLIFGINDSGQVVGQYLDSNVSTGVNSGFVYDNGVFTDLGETPIIPASINNNGQIVGSSADYSSGFIYNGGVFSALNGIIPYGINNNGQMVGTDSSGQHGVIDNGGVLTALDVPGALQTVPIGINDSGQISGTYKDANHVFHGFMLDGGVFTTLDIQGATYTLAYGINNSGQIVGYYIDASNVNHSFIATPATPTASVSVPIPAITTWLFASALAVLSIYKRRLGKTAA